MRTGIVIITFNIDTRLFLLQVECIRKFCQDDFCIEIIDNSSEKSSAEAIEYHCGILGLNYTRTHATTRDSSQSHSFAANASFNQLKDSYDILFYLDHDCLPVAPFSCDGILGENLMAGLKQKKQQTYFWPGCFMFRSNKIDGSIVDFSINREYGLDTGGNLYKLIEYYGEGDCVFFSEEYRQNPEYSGRYDYFSIINNIFWHCIGGSNWFKIGDHTARINRFINAVQEAIKL